MATDAQGYTSAEAAVVVAQTAVEERARTKQCYQQCPLCEHCKGFSYQFAECRACYPDSPEYRQLLQQWEHCNCYNMPWNDRVGGQSRNNVVAKPTKGNARAAKRNRELLQQEVDKPKQLGDDIEELGKLGAQVRR